MATILVVDDRPSNRQFLTTLLGYMGHRLLEAADGADALSLVQSARPDLVITDILMPTMDGYEFVNRMRAVPELTATPVIFYTATYSEPQAKTLAASCGVRVVLPKPCEPECIVAAVNEELGVEHRPLPSADGDRHPVDARDGHAVKVIVADYLKDLQGVKVKFDGIVKRSATVRGDRDRIRNLSRKFSENVAQLQRVTSRLSALIDVGLAMNAEREPERLLRLFFAAACDIIDARFAAIGVLNADEAAWRYVFTKNVDASIFDNDMETRTGLLGSVVAERRTIRAASAEHVRGMPGRHPAVSNILATPIASSERAYGWIYFADKLRGREFTDEDERLAGIMATQLALRYEHARLYELVERHAASLQVEVAERRRAQNALLEREAGLQRAQLMARLAHVITGAAGEFLTWSDSLASLIGVEAGAIPRNTREWLELVHAEDRASVRQAAIEAAKSGARTDVEYRLKRGESWVHLRQVFERLSLHSSENGALRWFNTIQDVTEQKQADQALLESESRFRQVTENIREVFWLTDPAKNQMLYVSPAYQEIWGRSATALYESPLDWLEAIHPGDRPRVLQAARTKQVSGDYDEEYRITRPDGSIRWIRDRAFPVVDKDRTVARVVGVAEDITESKLQRDKIERLTRMYAVLSGINAAIVRIRNRDDLFRECCRIAVEAGRFARAHVSVVERGEQKLRTVADARLQELANPPPSPEVGSCDVDGAATLAIRERRAIVVNDIACDSRFAHAKTDPGQSTRSLAALPLLVAGNPVGVLALHSPEVGYFDDEEMRLLLELAGDVSFALEHIERSAQIDYLALYDSLTGLANRTLFLDRLDQRVHLAKQSDEEIAVVLTDVERLRIVNDSLGRQAGDALLKELAKRLARGASRDELARLSTDNFAVVLASVKNSTDAARRVERLLHECLTDPFRIEGADLTIALKAGIALYPRDGTDPETLLRNAEAALRRAKRTAQRYVFHAPEMTERTAERLSLENRLRRALENEEYVVHYQPKVDLETRRIVGVEALIRWQQPDQRLVYPGTFLPVLEETGLILEVGTWVLHHAVAAYRRLVEQELAAPRIAVNLSLMQLRQHNFVDVVKQAIASGATPAGIDLEVTESMPMDNVEDNVSKLRAVCDLGFSIAIDDFGTGYSSLGYLAKLPAHALKIDRSFIVSMLDDPDKMTMVSMIISLAHSMRLTVIAEGVEEEEQAKILRLLRCDQAQGYLFSRPVPFEELESLLRAN